MYSTGRDRHIAVDVERLRKIASVGSGIFRMLAGQEPDYHRVRNKIPQPIGKIYECP